MANRSENDQVTADFFITFDDNICSMELKYYPKPIASILHLTLFLLVFLLFMARTYEIFRLNIIHDILPDFQLHISNFSISYFFISGVCYLWILMGVPFRYVLYASALILLINFSYEMWIPVLNTLDITDAYYGLVGVLFATIEVYLIRRWGVIPNPNKENEPHEILG